MHARVAVVPMLVLVLAAPLAAQQPYVSKPGTLVRIVSAHEGLVAQGVLVRLAPDTAVLGANGREQAFPLGSDRRLEVGVGTSRLRAAASGTFTGLLAGGIFGLALGGYALVGTVPLGSGLGMLLGALSGREVWLPAPTKLPPPPER